MKQQITYITESGKPLNNSDDGFIIYGCILKADNEGGVFGGGETMKALKEAGVEPAAYTNEEFIKQLAIDPFELKRIAESLMLHTRGFSGDILSATVFSA